MAKMQRVPPLTANTHQACYSCFKEESTDCQLKRCSRCRRVSYCSVECQTNNWSEHKAFCKALLAVERGLTAQPNMRIIDAPSTDVQFLNLIGEQDGRTKSRMWEAAANRELTLIERNLIGWEPRCIACACTDQGIRVQSAQSPDQQTGAITRYIRPCPDCGLTFYCSEEHWNVAKQAHREEPCEDGHDHLSQCMSNQEIRADIQFAELMSEAMPNFQWASERTKSAWVSLKGATWKGEFEDDLRREFQQQGGLMPPVDPFLRAASEGLTLPMSILWAMENLNDNDAWTRRENLTVHLLGAYDKEFMSARIFEELLHRLPEVKTLELILCGPQIGEIIPPGQRDKGLKMDTCPNCRRRGRQRIHYHSATTYHDYMTELGERFVKPDLAVAFNSGCSQEAIASWQKTVKLLVNHKIPTVFTAYNREEAEAEASILSEAGAHLVDALGPRRNPWSSLLARTEPSRVLGFYAGNGWLAGGFK